MRRAWGFAAAYKNTGLGGGSPDKSSAELELYPDGSMLATTGSYGVELWAMPDANHIKTLDNSQRATNYLAISPDGRFLACASRDGYVLVYTLPDGNLSTTLN